MQIKVIESESVDSAREIEFDVGVVNGEPSDKSTEPCIL